MLADATLPTATRAALAVAMLAGACLILFGARVLRPAVVLAAMTIGFLGAIVAARHALPQVPLWAAAATGAVAGLLGGALLYRPTVAVAAASVGGTVGAIIAFAVMAGGSLDTAPRDLGHALVASPREAARPGDGQRVAARAARRGDRHRRSVETEQPRETARQRRIPPRLASRSRPPGNKPRRRSMPRANKRQHKSPEPANRPPPSSMPCATR
jgi:hypothetical protein